MNDIEKLIRFILSFVALCIGVGAGMYLGDFLQMIILTKVPEEVYTLLIPGALGIAFALIMLMFSNFAIIRAKKFVAYVQTEIEKLPPKERAVGIAGLIVGFFVAFLLSGLYDIIPFNAAANGLKILTYLFLGYFGIVTAQRFLKEPFRMQDLIDKAHDMTFKDKKIGAYLKPKLLDTSVIIDGRIVDICKTGFIEGALIVPEFVLGELRHIADASDSLKRSKGRRGLDVLKMLQAETSIVLKIVEEDFPEVQEVDIKLIKLAQKMGASIVTNDYNLNKVAILQAVKILNINELSNAIKPIFIPGEEVQVQIIKAGKENNQGIGYLEDGTMIVVEEGKSFLQEYREVVVTSVLQTAAGRMIFARLKSNV